MPRPCAATEHGDLQPDRAAAGSDVSGSDVSGIAMVAGHRHLAVRTKVALVVQCLLEDGWQLRRDLAFRLRFQVIQQSHRGLAP